MLGDWNCSGMHFGLVTNGCDWRAITNSRCHDSSPSHISTCKPEYDSPSRVGMGSCILLHALWTGKQRAFCAILLAATIPPSTASTDDESVTTRWHRQLEWTAGWLEVSPGIHFVLDNMRAFHRCSLSLEASADLSIQLSAGSESIINSSHRQPHKAGALRHLSSRYAEVDQGEALQTSTLDCGKASCIFPH